MTDIAAWIHAGGTRFTLIYPHAFPEEGVTVPTGFTCDMASVPKLLWFWLPPLGHYQRAALLHDWLYNLNRTLSLNYADRVLCSALNLRQWADRAFLRQMKRDGVGWRTRYTMYLAVRVFGGKAWRGA